MKRRLAALAAATFCACAGPSPSTQPTFISSDATREAGLPFSEAVRVGPLIFASGQIGAAPGSLSVVPGGIEPETGQALENIAAVLRRSGSSMDRVVKCTIFLADVSEWAAFNRVYVQFFDPDALPARSALGANGLAGGARVEVECIASVGDERASAVGESPSASRMDPGTARDLDEGARARSSRETSSSSPRDDRRTRRARTG